LFVLCGSVQPVLAQQTVNFTVGFFTVRGDDSRVDDDVLLENSEFLSFDIEEFNGITFGGEWLFPLGNFIEGSAGLGFYSQSVPSVYTDFFASDRTEIEQELKLRIIPVAFTFRVLPLGQSSPVQPYFGAGIGIFSWKYTESGDFINFGTPNLRVDPGTFEASGSETGPIVLGGIRFSGDALSVGGEVRYQSAEGELSNEFAGDKIDLGGWTYQATIGIRFGR
jgi:hypothetical protein